MVSRRGILQGAAVVPAVALAGCAEMLRGGPVPEVGQPELRGSLVDTDTDTATVIVEVRNTGPTGEIVVVASVVDDNDRVLESYEQTVEIAGGESRTLEFDVDPREDAATVTVRASSG
jgi:hypothetical protein